MAKLQNKISISHKREKFLQKTLSQVVKSGPNSTNFLTSNIPGGGRVAINLSLFGWTWTSILWKQINNEQKVLMYK